RPAAPPAGRFPATAGDHRDRPGHHGKSTRALGADLRERAGRTQVQEALMGAYTELTAAGVTTRTAANLTGVPRATATRTTRRGQDRPGEPTRQEPTPANKLTDIERARVLEVLNSEEFVDQPPAQIYAALLARGQYLCSIATMYRVLAAAAQ